MRLKKIKLSGFKSFVDVATFPVEKNLVGIVGPNGCGKSNVIDAVRWVMGESSAKQLRGDSMTDVIFNGTATRKPVSQASVELVFDNSIKQLAGQYANYSEISVKRVINREGTSQYYLNNTKCRRKDLLDLFMGTGLGPRSYTIIEQGMISRVIEAKPEDLRVYLEEAAGISKYKERRRETENRIKHTRENLDRVNDITEELGKQLEKLSRQAETAEKYKVLKQELTVNEEYYLGLQHREFNHSFKELTTKVNEKNIAVEELNSQIESNNLELEKKRILVSSLQAQQQEQQARYYKIEQNINTKEQDIKHLESEKSHTQSNISSTAKQIEYCSNNLESKKSELNIVSAELEVKEPEHEELLLLTSESKDSLQELESSFSTWEREWNETQELLNNNSKIVSQSQALIEKHDTLIVRSQKRLDILKQEKEAIRYNQNNNVLNGLRDKFSTISEQEEIKQNQLEELVENIDVNEQSIDDLQETLSNLNDELQAKKGRLSSLKTIQENSLGKDQKELSKWLDNHGLGNCKRLGEVVNIENGWECALETILRDYIKAVVLPDGQNINDYDFLVDELNNQNAAFISLGGSNNIKNISNQKYDLLIDKVTAPNEIALLLNNIYCADSVEDAKSKLNNLECYESIITKDGVWLNAHWFTANTSNDNNKGGESSIIAREQDIQELSHKIEELEQEVSSLKQSLVIKKTDLAELKANKEELQREIREIIKSSSEIKSEISREESKLEEQKNRLFKLEQDITETVKHVEVDETAVKSERSKLVDLMQSMEQLSYSKDELQQRGDEIRTKLKTSRSYYDEHKDKVHKSELSIQKLKQQNKHLNEEISSLSKQKERLNKELLSLQEKLDGFDAPIEELKEQLEALLEEKGEQNEILSEKTEQHELANQELTAIERNISDLRKRLDSLRDENESLKIKQHEISTKLAAINDEVLEKELDIESIIQKIPEDANQNKLRNVIRGLKTQIDDLGPVNLTAIEEYNVEAERKSYLDSQHNDLLQALTSLEEAIAQIDEETKARFKETFDFVNEQFQYLFPKIFGGGRAILSLSGEDLLDTGVTVMAQPPGKRNSSIHLLSGGEKALTAIALVFSIFRLNPAPFCMLDEVDAPLDDANVARYCNMVREMSSDIQFIFITHNKVTMTMAEHLVGVTQHELGASRLVAVDVDEASKLVDA